MSDEQRRDPGSSAPEAPPSGDPAETGRLATDATVSAADISALPTVAPVRVSLPDGRASWTGDPARDVTPEADGRYTTAQEQGRGGQARVLVVHDRHLGRDVAWKELLPDWFAGDGTAPTATHPVVRRFLREARIAAQLEHPNIVPVHEIGRRADGSVYYTMRLVHGQTLAHRLEACRSLAERLKLLGAFWDLCNAVAYAHDRGVIHRDLKPGNVMVGEFGETVVLDWGLAKVRGRDDPRAADLERGARRLRPDVGDAGGSAAETMDGDAMGTPSYMSPEQAVGRVDAMDERTDVWGLGAVLFEILTGAPPYDGENAAQVVRKVLVEPVRPVREVCPEAPPELAEIAEKALRRERSERYADARELAADVAAYMTGKRVLAHEYTSWELLRRFAARNKAALGAAGAVLAVILGALIVLSIAWRGEAAARVREHAAQLEAQYHLSEAYAQQATRLLGEGQFLSARIHGAASLLHNPAHRGGAVWDEGFAARTPGAERLRTQALSAIYRSGFQPLGGLLRGFRMADAVMAADCSPDGRQLAALDRTGLLVVRDTADGAEVLRLQAFDGPSIGLAFAPDGRLFAAGSEGIKVFRPPSPAVVLRIPPVDSTAIVLAVSPDGRTLAATYKDGSLRLWDAATGAPLRRVQAHESQSWGLAWSPDGRWLATGGWDETARLWDAATLAPVATLRGHTEAVYRVRFSPDSRRLVTAGYDATARVWSVPDGASVAVLSGAQDGIYDASFSADGRFVAAASADRMLRFWDVPSGELRLTLEAHHDAVSAVVFAPGGDRVVSASQDGTVRLWRWNGSDGLVRLPHPDTIYGLAVSADGQRVATACWDRTARVWDAASGALLQTMAGHTDGVTNVAFSPDGTRLATTSYDQTVRLWDVATGRSLTVLTGHTSRVKSAAFSPDGRLLASGGADDAIRLWDPATGSAVAELSPAGGTVNTVVFDPSGRWLASASDDRRVRIWDVASRAVVRTLAGHDDWVVGLAFSGDGRYLASAGKDRAALLWETGTWRLLRRFVGHEQAVNVPALTRDGALLATAADDGRVLLWNTADGRVLLELATPGAAQAAVFSPDGARLFVNASKTTVAYPVTLPDPSADAAALLRAAETAAGLRLDGFGLEVAPTP